MMQQFCSLFCVRIHWGFIAISSSSRPNPCQAPPQHMLFWASIIAEDDKIFHPFHSTFSHLCKNVCSWPTRMDGAGVIMSLISPLSRGSLNIMDRSFMQSFLKGCLLGTLSLIRFTAWNISSFTLRCFPNTCWSLFSNCQYKTLLSFYLASLTCQVAKLIGFRMSSSWWVAT